MTTFLAFLSRNGLTFVNPWQARRNYVRPAKGALSQDFYRVVGDMRVVGQDLRKTAQKELVYGQ
jgi:hypothetical protein